MAAGIVAVIVATVTVGPARRAYREMKLRHALARLASVAPSRSSSRLSMAAPPPVRVATRSGNAEATLPGELYDAIVDVLNNAKGGDSSAARQASAVVNYHVGRFAAAARDLESIAKMAGSAVDWNDLAAARLEAALAANAPQEIVPALVAADQALHRQPDFPAALYNRAAVLEKMGLRMQARQAWQHCLVSENDPAWRDRIREHLSTTSPEPDDEAWSKAMARIDADASDELRETVERFPQQARAAAEAVLPSDWALATIASDKTTAFAKLKMARALASALRNRSGESMAADGIAVIDASLASGNAGRVAQLANAYALYRRGRVLYRNHDLSTAEATLRDAAEAFTKAGSPMAGAARYYAANAVLDQNRADEAARQYATLAIEMQERRYGALGSHIAWQMARTEGVRGHWDAALEAATRSVAGFRALGEKENIGTMENMLAELYDYLGQPERAWTHRRVAYDLMSAAGAYYRLQVAVGAASRICIRRKDWPAAIALLGPEIAISQTVGDPALVADALARRARARAANGEPAAAALLDITAARAAAGRLPDPKLRAKVDIDIDVAQAIIERDQHAAQSVRLLTNAITFHERDGSILLPELFLERGRARLALGAEQDALEDFAAGIERLEVQRAAVTEFELSSTALDVGEDLYVEAVRLAVKRDDAARAYDFSERSRGRALAQRMTAGNARPLTPIGERPGVLLVEYMVLPERIVAFTVDREVRMTVLNVNRDDLERMVERLDDAIVTRRSLDEVQAASGVLYDTLLRPLGPIAGRATMVFAPSKVLERVPWAALYDRETGRYLAEETIVVSAPSAAVLALAAPANVPPSKARALVVGNPLSSPAFVDLPPLPAAENEARLVARSYASPLLLLGAEATLLRVVRAAKDYDVFHFAGHAVSSDTSEDQSFLVLAPDDVTGDSGVLYSRDIAKLPLKNVRLVVLAACGTMRGSTVHLDGMPSIARSFLAAGAGAVIGTLWDVEDDRSAALFAQIHRAVAAGAPVAQAMHDMQVDAIRSSDARVAHPKTWAGLTLVGGL